MAPGEPDEAALERLARCILDEARAAWPCLPRGARIGLARLLQEPRASAALRRAERELVRVHRVELALLLREAARLRAALLPGGAALLEQLGEAPWALATWRAAFAEALACAASDRLRLPLDLALVLARLRAPAPGSWGDPRELADAALRLEPCAEGRLCAAHVALARGDADRSRALLAAELLQSAPAALRRRAARALAWIERSRGRPRLAAALASASGLEAPPA